MFTPPASPQPNPGASFASVSEKAPSSSRHLSPPPATSPSPQKSTHHHRSPSAQDEVKRRAGRRFRNAVILVPIVLIAITVTARLLSQGPPPVLASLSSSFQWPHLFPNPPCSKQPDLERAAPVHLDKREPSPQQPTTTTTSTPASTSSSTPTSGSAAGPVPTVPSTAPALPTPFPQAFDGVIAKNFSTVSCLNFFMGMINAQPFRSCRPFSLLLETSNDFVDAQRNLTLLNNLIWGTCNTVTSEDQCVSNVAGFAASLRTECAQELKEGNVMASNTLIALDAYPLMRTSACLSDPTTNTYCFLNFARDQNPTNLYYYSLPLGTKLSERADPQCNACLKSLTGVYATALKDQNQRSNLPGLVKTYEGAAANALGKCGAGFAQAGIVSSAEPKHGYTVATRVAVGLSLVWSLWMSALGGGLF